MSFTAEAKDELSRIDPDSFEANRAELSALIRVCGTLSFRGPGRYSIRISTETGAVARMVIKLTHSLYHLEPSLTVRRSVMHKTRNYLIEIPEQDGLEDALYDLGILAVGQGLSQGVEKRLVKDRTSLESYIRGAFLAGGFISDPRGGFHLEICVTGQPLAQDLVELMSELGVSAKLYHRRGSWAIYIKNFEDTVKLMEAIGAKDASYAMEEVRKVKSVKNNINRKVNAEIANQARSVSASAKHLQLIDKAEELVGLDQLPPAVREFCELRRAYPDLSLRDLGEQAEPQLSKSALFHRIKRLEQIVGESK